MITSFAHHLPDCAFALQAAASQIKLLPKQSLLDASEAGHLPPQVNTCRVSLSPPPFLLHTSSPSLPPSLPNSQHTTFSPHPLLTLPQTPCPTYPTCAITTAHNPHMCCSLQIADADAAEWRLMLADKHAELERVHTEYTALCEQFHQGQKNATQSIPNVAPNVASRTKSDLLGQKVAAPEWYCPDADTLVEGVIIADLSDLGRAVIRWPERKVEYTYAELQQILVQPEQKSSTTSSSSVCAGPKAQVQLPPLLCVHPAKAASPQCTLHSSDPIELHPCPHEAGPEKPHPPAVLPQSPPKTRVATDGQCTLRLCGTPGCGLPDFHRGLCQPWHVEGKRQRTPTSPLNIRLPSLHTVAAVNDDFVGCKVEVWNVPGQGMGLFARAHIKQRELFSYYELFTHYRAVRDSEYCVESHEAGANFHTTTLSHRQPSPHLSSCLSHRCHCVGH